MRYAIVIERAEQNDSADVPDLLGCVATRSTVAEVEAQIREAIVFHVEGLRDDGMPVPDGASQVEYVIKREVLTFVAQMGLKNRS